MLMLVLKWYEADKFCLFLGGKSNESETYLNESETYLPVELGLEVDLNLRPVDLEEEHLDLDLPLWDLRCTSLALACALATILFICDVKVKLEQNCTPRSLTVFTDWTMLPYSLKLVQHIFRRGIARSAIKYNSMMITTINQSNRIESNRSIYHINQINHINLISVINQSNTFQLNDCIQ